MPLTPDRGVNNLINSRTPNEELNYNLQSIHIKGSSALASPMP